MAQVILSGGFSAISCDILRSSTTTHGQLLDEANHIFNIREIQTTDSNYFEAMSVREANVGSTPYSLRSELDSNRNVTTGRCSCVAGGDGLCKHIGGLVHAINSERSESQTDTTVSWFKPSERGRLLYPKGKRIVEIFPKLTPCPDASFNPPNIEDQDSYLELLKQAGCENSMMFSLLNSHTDHQTAATPPPPSLVALPEWIQDIFVPLQAPFHFLILSPDRSGLEPIQSLADSSIEQFYDSNIRTDQRRAFEICNMTRLQAKSPEWFFQRKTRITASAAHKIWRAKKTETRWKYFFQSATNLPSLEYGRLMEPVAREAFSNLTDFVVEDVGLVVRCDQSWLAGTPDGVFKDANGNVCLLEIKCPSSCKGKKIEVDYLEDRELKKSHPYYTQVQIQLYVCNCAFCYFYVYTSVDQVLAIIERDEELL